MNGNTAVKRESDEEIEREALEFFLDSVQKELNDRFPLFSSFVSHSRSLPQLIISLSKEREKK